MGYWLTFPTVSREKRVRLSYGPQMVFLVYLVKISDCGSEEQGSIPENTQNNWEDNGGCLPALDAGGRRFESCFSDKNEV